MNQYNFSEDHPPKQSTPTRWVAAVLLVIAAVIGLIFAFKFLIYSKICCQSGPDVSDLINSSPVGDFVGDSAAIKTFASKEELKDFIYTHLQASSSPAYYDYGDALAVEASSNVALGLGASPLQKTDYSETNVQVAGVDEADIIKTDGEYVYAVSKKNLFIVKAYPAENAEIVAQIAFDSTPRNIYVQDNFLAVYGNDEVIFENDTYDLLPRPSSFTFFKVFDISDRKNPVQVRDLDFEGGFIDSRLVGDYVYFVTSYSPSSGFVYDDPIPMILEDGELLPTDPAKAGCNCPDVHYFALDYDNYSLTSVAAINIGNQVEAVKSQVYLLDVSQDMYVSQDNMYLAYNKRVSDAELYVAVTRDLLFSRLDALHQAWILDIESSPNYVLSDAEKDAKIGGLLELYANSLSDEEQEKLEKEIEAEAGKRYEQLVDEIETTTIHKIALKDGALEYRASGRVSGYTLNQFAMDEHDGYFRVATTRGQFFSNFIPEEQRESYSNVYVLDEEMNTVGKVENLAPGEKIYSARFMQGRVYLVTFEQIDPLFAIDLADPRQPRVLGELKVPGFSSYLHPYSDKLLIGFGKETQVNENGGVTTKGLKLSLFDVSDVKNLREIDTYTMGGQGSESEALEDHKAFLFSQEKSLLSVPVTLRGPTGDISYGDITFRGAMVFSATENGFELKGQIDHWDGRLDEDQYESWYGYGYYDNTVKRALYIEDTLYTFSNNYLRMNDLADLKEVKNLQLKTASGDDFEIIN